MQIGSAPERVGNLDASSQDTQLRVGLFSLVAALAGAAFLSKTGASPIYRTLMFLPFFAASYGVLAALYATCGISAIAGRRFTCQGTDRIVSRSDLALHRAKGVKVLSLSMVLAAIATACFVFTS